MWGKNSTSLQHGQYILSPPQHLVIFHMMAGPTLAVGSDGTAGLWASSVQLPFIAQTHQVAEICAMRKCMNTEVVRY